MKTNYIAPLTEIVYLNTENILDPSQDSTGTLPGDDPDLGANRVVLDQEEFDVQKNQNLWDD